MRTVSAAHVPTRSLCWASFFAIHPCRSGSDHAAAARSASTACSYFLLARCGAHGSGRAGYAGGARRCWAPRCRLLRLLSPCAPSHQLPRVLGRDPNHALLARPEPPVVTLRAALVAVWGRPPLMVVAVTGRALSWRLTGARAWLPTLRLLSDRSWLAVLRLLRDDQNPSNIAAALSETLCFRLLRDDENPSSRHRRSLARTRCSS